MKPVASLLLESGVAVHVYESGTFELAACPSPCDGRLDLGGSLKFTEALLAGCMTAALREVAPFTIPRSASLARYVFSLRINYHTTKATASYFPQIASKLEQRGRQDLAKVVKRKFKEERDHWRLAHADLTELGVKDDELIQLPDRASAVTDLLANIAADDDPVTVLGYAYVLERLAKIVDCGTLARAQSIIPAGKNATRCLRAHSSFGDEPSHVRELLASIAMCDSNCIRRIGHSAYSTMCAMAQPFDDEESLACMSGEP